MFQFLFRYPVTVFTKGHYVLLGRWPVWVLLLLVVDAAILLGVLINLRRRGAAPLLRTWRAWVLWGMQTGLAAILLLLLWEPAVRVAELSSEQNIIAVVVDDSRSMATGDVGGKTREAAALSTLESGVLAGLQKRFQTRIYRLDRGLTRVEGEAITGKGGALTGKGEELAGIAPTGSATRIGEGLKELATDTADLPVGAVVLLTDGGENAVGVGGSNLGADALEALRNRRLPVHTIGFGAEEIGHDVEVEDVSVAANAVAGARVAATVSLMERGFAGAKAKLTVRDGAGTLVAAREITLAPNGVIETETIYFSAGAAGAKTLTFGVEPLAGEENTRNNAVTRPVLVSDAKRRILYVEGEPRWEFKFIRRAEDDDPTVQLVTMLRTSENKIYRQGISGPGELADGFPVRAEDLFGYAGIIIGSVDADYFTPLQKELLREYIDRRGGGVLFLGGRSSLSDGGWAASSLAEVMPTFLPAGRSSFHRNAATVELTSAGVESPVTRLLEDPSKNEGRWKKLTYLADYEDAGTPKPGATVLATLRAGGRKLPFLVTENYGHGRTAVLATGGTWRWQMSEALGDGSHDLFWQQLLRWLVADSPGPVTEGVLARTMMDSGRVRLSAVVRDKEFKPAGDARVSVHVVGPSGVDAVVDLRPSQETPGLYEGDWTAEKAGAYLSEVTADGADGVELGRDVVTFQREDGVAENFHTAQNRGLLEGLARETGGRYWRASEVGRLPGEIAYSEAGISVRSTKELWDMPIVLLLLLGLAAGEWLLRRKWGVV